MMMEQQREPQTPEEIARTLGGGPSDMMGLWQIPFHPELTTNQLFQVWSEREVVRTLK